jgi:peptide/nickel transport system substrate-binding protein
MRRARGVALVAAGLTLVAGSSRAALGPRYGGEARVAAAALPAAFLAVPARGSAGRLVSALVHERLVEVGPGGTLLPALAEGWTESADGRELRIRLRPGAVFHDGSAVMPFDVARSLHAFLRSPSPAAARLAAVLDGIAFDDGIVLRLREPFPLALAVLAAPEAAITSPRGAGAGPFVPTTRAPIRGSGRFVAFPRHVRGRPYLDAIALGDDPAGLGGEANLSPAAADGPLAATLLLVLDPRHAPFQRLDDRRRVAAAVDAAGLRRHFLPGAEPSGLLPPALLPAPAEAAPLPPTGRVAGAITLAVGTDVAQAVSQRVVAHLTAAGLRVTAMPLPPDRVWDAPAAARLLAFAPAIPEPLLALDEIAALAPAEEGLARARRDEAARTADPVLRGALVRRAEAEMRAAAIVVPLAAVPAGFTVRAGLHGVVTDAAGRTRLEDAWLEP